MKTQEMVAGLREIAAKAAKVKEDPCIDNAREMFAATAHVVNHASAIADEMERLRAENEKMRKALTSASTHMRDDSHLRRFPVTWALIDSALDAKGGG